MDLSFEAAPSPRAYNTIAELVYQHSRIKLGDDKQALLANRLRTRLRDLGLGSFDEYCDLLQSRAGDEEISRLVDLISTNHTKFFREPEHFTFLSETILPELVPRLREEGSPLRIWSAAASSGEEPYTLAIVLAEFLRAQPPLPWQVTGSDISQRALAKARQGIYPAEALEPVPDHLKKRYFQQGTGPREGSCRIKPELARHVHFEAINLFQPEYQVPAAIEVIFCRNVMIYFDAPSRGGLLRQLTSHLAPGGYLFVGKAESLFGLTHGLENVQHSVYRKP